MLMSMGTHWLRPGRGGNLPRDPGGRGAARIGLGASLRGCMTEAAGPAGAATIQAPRGHGRPEGGPAG